MPVLSRGYFKRPKQRRTNQPPSLVSFSQNTTYRVPCIFAFMVRAVDNMLDLEIRHSSDIRKH